MTDDPRWEPFCLLVREPTAEQRHNAARTVAAHATDADDLRELLDMLGLTAADGVAVQPERDDSPAVPHGPPADVLAELAEFRRRLSRAS